MPHTLALKRLVSLSLIGFAASTFAQTSVPVVPPNLTGAISGTLKGSADVTPFGAASYGMALAVPPGTAGVTPALGFSYSSQAGMSLMGQGWSLTGLSAISRCRRSIAQDGSTQALKLTAEDQFCLDGKRLLLEPGSGTHGASATYRTQIETFSRVRSSGSTPSNGPDSFRVEAKDGLIYTYGGTADSRIEAVEKSARHTWLVSRVEDRKGNYYAISYSENSTSGEYYPTRIRYTGNVGAGLTPYNAVNFVYETRPDVSRTYLVGSPINQTVRLKAVRTVINTAADGSGGTLVREYRVAYRQNPTNGRSLVEIISDCNGAGACLPSTQFAWTERNAASNNFSASGSGEWGGPEAVYESMAHKNVWASIAVVDMNGDGKTDLLKSLENGSWQVCLSTGASFNCQTWAGPNKKLKDVVMGDYNGDGRTDLAYDGGSAGKRICFSTGTGLSCVASASVPISGDTSSDFDGDGRVDSGFCYSQGGGAFNCETINTGQLGVVLEESAICPDEQRLRRNIPADFNGDGKIDFLVINMWSPVCSGGNPHAYFWALYTTVNGGTQVGLEAASAAGLGLVNQFYGRVPPPGSSVGRFNDDDYIDLVLQGVSGSQVRVCRGTGTRISTETEVGFDCASPQVDTAQLDHTVSHVGDVDGDGRADTIHFGASNQARVCQVAGDLTYTCADWAGAAGPAQIYADFNGDGKTDIAYYSDATKKWSIGLANGPTPDLLASVTDGVGRMVEFQYAGLEVSAVYTPGLDVPYPTRRADSGMNVVSRMRVSNGIGGWLTTSYTYKGSRTDQRGFGTLGFETISSVDSVSGSSTTSTYSQTYPTSGMKLDATVKSRLNVTLSASTNTVAALTTVGGAKYPYVQAATTSTWDLNGSSISTTTTTVNTGGIDAYGNVTNSTTMITGGAETFRTDTLNVYDNLVDPWLFLLRSSTVTKTATQTGTSTSLPTLSLTGCTSNSPTTTPTAATVQCVLANNGQTVARSIAYSAPAGTTVAGPSACSANQTNCGVVTLTTGTSAATYSGTLRATPTPSGSAATTSVSLVVNARPALTLSACTSTTPTVSPTAATLRCTVGNTGGPATSIAYSSPAGTTRSGPTSCAANTASCGTVTVTTGTSPSTYSGTLTATPTPSGTAATAAVNLTVNPTPPALTLSACTSTTPTVSPSKATMSCTLGNTGQAAATSVTYSSAAGTTRTGPTSCAGSTANCGTVTVSSGTAKGAYAGTLTATPTPAGSAATAAYNLEVKGSIAVLTSAASVTFTTTAQGAINPTANWIFRNDGDANMTLSLGTLNSPFSLSSNSCTNVAPGNSCAIWTKMATSTVGSFSQTGISVTGATSGNPSNLALAGVVSAVSTTLTVSPTSLGFGAVAKGLSKELSVTLTNTGSLTASGLVTATFTYTSGSAVIGSYAKSGGTCGTTLAAGASCTVKIIYDAVCTGGTRNGNVALSGGNFTTVSVALTASTSSSGVCN